MGNINKYIEDLGYQLISSENGILIICDNDGYYYSTRLGDLKREYSPRLVGISNPYSLENIKLWLKYNLNNFILISNNYLGTHNKLILKDKEGYYYTIPWSLLQTGEVPRKFYKSNPYTIQNIKLWCKLNNKPFELVSNTYIDASKSKLTWKCLKKECNEEFNMYWHMIHHGQFCPFCSGKQTAISNCLITKNPELASEWHLTKNGDLTPWDVTCGSNKKVWWECKECNHEWNVKINDRNNGNGCPNCNKSKGEKECKRIFDLKVVYYVPQKTFDGLLGLGNGLLSYDFYIPKYNLLVEYQGEFHDIEEKGKYKRTKYLTDNFEKQVEHDRCKKEYALENGYNFLEIWYWDFDNIEEILTKELNLLEEAMLAI